MTNPQQYERQYQAGLDKAHQNLERFLREDGSNVFDKPIWNDHPTLAGPGVNELLDQAAPGLEWFRLALVRYHRVWDVLKLPGFDSIVVEPLTVDGVAIGGERIDTTRDPDGEQGEMRRLEGTYYDQQRSMNLDSLRRLAIAFNGASAGTDSHPSTTDITTNLAGVKDAVPEAWQGNAGGAAQDYLAGFHAHADQQSQYLQAVAAALNGLPDVLLQIVKDKANFIAGFDSSQCPVAGHAMRLGGAEDPVSNIISVAAESTTWGYLYGETNQRAADQFHMTGVGPGTSEGSQKIRDACKQWLTDHFGPAVREAFKAFVHQCVLADHYIRRAYQPVMDLLDNHNPQPFPKPQDQQNPQPQNQQTPSSTSPASVTNTSPAGVNPTTPSNTNPTPHTPTSVNSPASPLNPLQTLAGLASQAGQAVQQGVSQLHSAVQQGLSGLGSDTTDTGSPVADPGTSPVSKTLAKFTIGGESIAVTQTPDGTVTATVTGPDGKSQQYSMGIKDGVPFFTPSGESPTVSTSADTSPAISSGVDDVPTEKPAPATQPGTERTPQVTTDTPSSFLVGGSQATAFEPELALAGPLASNAAPVAQHIETRAEAPADPMPQPVSAAQRNDG
ncbi:hypothetical protein [Nocardia pneumoniae]|uniref:hypothetical protein n=1 Tax=Nocardia pneumoniae TaxID=228601 RepID=UPI0002EC4CDB|nr:hypothetical protein [Nocardia pneumoniae]